jgi:predicted NUDIX family NTP pyrophosphohydrolase
VHPGGPFFTKKELGVWSIPKGEFEDPEEPLSAALRELAEETNIIVDGNFFPLPPVKMKSGKTIFAWALNANPDLSSFKSNTFGLEWPPKSGRLQHFPEVDKAEWFGISIARQRINISQVPFLDTLQAVLA